MTNEICVAIVRKPHGVRGEFKVTVLLDNEKDLCKISALKRKNDTVFHKIQKVFAVSDCYAIKLEGFNNANDVECFRGEKLYADKSEVDKLKSIDAVYIEDLINKPSFFEDGEEVGVIEDVVNYGANDIVFIKSDKYKNLSFANIGGIIVSVENDKVVLNKEEFNKVCVFDL